MVDSEKRGKSMTKAKDENKAPRDRSPAFPIISLRTAIDRLTAFEKAFGRHQTPVTKVGLAWDMKETGSQAGQTLAALKYFGLVQYDGKGNTRKAFITEEGRNYLRMQQDEGKQKLLKQFALNPKEIAKFWSIWGKDRPHDAVCLDSLVIDNEYNKKAAPLFLKVYDDTVAFAGLHPSDKIDPTKQSDDEEASDVSPDAGDEIKQPVVPIKRGIKLLEGEREITTGLLSKEAGFRLIVSGHIGKKEIDRLIKKLEFDRDILSEADDEVEEAEAS